MTGNTLWSGARQPPCSAGRANHRAYIDRLPWARKWLLLLAADIRHRWYRERTRGVQALFTEQWRHPHWYWICGDRGLSRV